MAGTGRMVGVDVGGTFTDLVELEAGTGQVRLSKVPSTLDNQAFGVLNALRTAGCDLAKLDLIVHGTTTTTNAVLERKLSPTGLITTAGFRDVLELGRRTRPQAYGMTGTFTPIIPRRLRMEVSERMDASGAVVTELDEDAVRAAGQALIDAGKAEAANRLRDRAGDAIDDALGDSDAAENIRDAASGVLGGLLGGDKDDDDDDEP